MDAGGRMNQETESRMYRMDFKDKALAQNIIGFVFFINNTFGTGYLRNKHMNIIIIFSFILSILKHPVNPVRVFLEKAIPSYCT